MAKSHYENFLVASVLSPRRLRQPFYDVYAFCRTADDLADRSPTPSIAGRRLAEFQQCLDATYAGDPPTDPFVALADTISRFSLPKQPFDDLLHAFRQDQSVQRYQSFDQLQDYCRRSANPVGRIVLRLSDSLDDDSAALSDQICTGLQLANFWQDISRDFAIGRVYLPCDEMERCGVTEADLAKGIAARSTPENVRRVIAAQCDVAEAFFDRGLPLVQRVPNWLAADVRLFVAGGMATLQAIRRIDFDVLRIRPTVGKVKQMSLMLRVLIGR